MLSDNERLWRISAEGTITAGSTGVVMYAVTDYADRLPNAGDAYSALAPTADEGQAGGIFEVHEVRQVGRPDAALTDPDRFRFVHDQRTRRVIHASAWDAGRWPVDHGTGGIALWKIDAEECHGDGGGHVTLFALTDDVTKLPDPHAAVAAADEFRESKPSSLYMVKRVELVDRPEGGTTHYEGVHDQRARRLIPFAAFA